MSDELLTDVTFEALPFLASHPDFAKLADRVRYLKKIKDEIFTDSKDKQGKPLGEWNQLRIELGALVAVAGVKSVVYQDLRITNTEPTSAGEAGSGSIEPDKFAMLLGEEFKAKANDPAVSVFDLVQQLLDVIAAARSFDEDALLEAGIAPHLIVRSRGIGKGRSGTTRIEWVGKKGRGSAAKQGSGGSLQ